MADWEGYPVIMNRRHHWQRLPGVMMAGRGCGKSRGWPLPLVAARGRRSRDQGPKRAATAGSGGCSRFLHRLI